jgi:hypothetical protein
VWPRPVGCDGCRGIIVEGALLRLLVPVEADSNASTVSTSSCSNVFATSAANSLSPTADSKLARI